MILRMDYSLALTIWNAVCTIVPLDQTHLGRSEGEVSALPMVLLHGLEDLFHFLKCNRAIPQVMERFSREHGMVQRDFSVFVGA